MTTPNTDSGQEQILMNILENIDLSTRETDWLEKELRDLIKQVKSQTVQRTIERVKKEVLNHHKQNTYDDNEAAVYHTTIKEILNLPSLNPEINDNESLK